MISQNQMLNIFKYFVGVIGVLILAYVLIVIIRTVLITGFATGQAVATSTAIQQTVASGTNNVVNAIKGFSFATMSDWLLNHRLVSVSPIYVGYDQENAPYSFFGNNEGKGFKTQQQLYFQNLNQAPNDHPTDWVPVGKSYSQTLGESDCLDPENCEEGAKLKVDSNLILPNTKPHSVLQDKTVITGKAFFKVFSLRKFPIYILDRDANTIGEFMAYANSNIERDGGVQFRAVVDLNTVNVRQVPYGFLMFKNDNEELSKIKAVTLLPVLFQK